MNTALTILPITGLNGIDLKRGSHPNREDGLCGMEAAAWMAGEEHTAAPVCVDRVITRFITSWNDWLPTDADRNRLIKPLLPEILGTRASREIELQRGKMCLEWSTTFVTPAALSLAGFGAAAEHLLNDPSLENLDAIRQEVKAAAEQRFGKAAFEEAYASASASASAYAYAYASASAYAYAYASASAYASAYASASAYAKLAGKDFAPLTAALEEGATALVRRMIALSPSKPEQGIGRTKATV